MKNLLFVVAFAAITLQSCISTKGLTPAEANTTYGITKVPEVIAEFTSITTPKGEVIPLTLSDSLVYYPAVGWWYCSYTRPDSKARRAKKGKTEVLWCRWDMAAQSGHLGGYSFVLENGCPRFFAAFGGGVKPPTATVKNGNCSDN